MQPLPKKIKVFLNRQLQFWNLYQRLSKR